MDVVGYVSSMVQGLSTKDRSRELSQMGERWQPGNQVARKFWKNQALAESFWILLLLPHFLDSKQFGESIKEIILVFLANGHIFYPFFNKIPKIQ